MNLMNTYDPADVDINEGQEKVADAREAAQEGAEQVQRGADRLANDQEDAKRASER